MYYLKLNEDSYILSASYEQLQDTVEVETIPDGDITEYQYVKGNFIHNPIPHEFTAQERIGELKKMLTGTDYQAIKFVEGQISIADYEPIKLQRQVWRNEINALGG